MWKEVSSGDNISYTNNSGWSGSGSAEGSATTGSSMASVLHIQPSVPQPVTAFTSSTVGLANGSTSGVGEEDHQKYTHWTLLLTGIETLGDNKTQDQERFRQYLSLMVNILLDISLDKGNASLCNSTTRLFTMLPKIGKWTKVLEGAERLLQILDSCFLPSLGNISVCTASASRTAEGAQHSRSNLEMTTVQGNASEREAGKKPALRNTKQQLVAIQAWAKHLENHFSLIQNISRDTMHLTGTNVSLQCQLPGWQKNSLAQNLNTLSAAVSDLLRIFTDLHDFGLLLNELRHWKGPVRLSSRRRNYYALRSYTEVTFFLTKAISSLDGARNTFKTCQSKRFCQDAKKTLVYLDRLPFILSAKRLQLEYLVSLACQIVSKQEGKGTGNDFSRGEKACPAMGGPICVDTLILNCTEDVWVRTSNPHSSFSPELSHHDYIVRTIGFSLIDQNWSTSVSKPWCRLTCKPGPYWPKLHQWTREIAAHVINTILLLFVLLSCYLLLFNKRNRYRMTNNPRRAYLYLNVCGVVNHFVLSQGLYTPQEIWCNSDGSLVMDSDDASVGCKLQASVKIATHFMLTSALVWAVYLWIRTMIDLQKKHKIEQEVYCLGLTVQELVEVAVVTTTILVSAVMISLPFLGEGVLHFRVEGSPSLHMCYSVDYLKSAWAYGSFLIVNIGIGVGFFAFSKTLRALVMKRQKTCGAMYRAAHQRDSQAALMLKWLHRHVVFGSIQLFRSLFYFIVFADNLQSQANKQSFKVRVDKYLKCMLSFHCPRECHLDLPATDMSATVVVLIVVIGIITFFSHMWIFFDEIEWNTLSKLRPRFKI